jgi:hypothetical protein
MFMVWILDFRDSTSHRTDRNPTARTKNLGIHDLFEPPHSRTLHRHYLGSSSAERRKALTMQFRTLLLVLLFHAQSTCLVGSSRIIRGGDTAVPVRRTIDGIFCHFSPHRPARLTQSFLSQDDAFVVGAQRRSLVLGLDFIGLINGIMCRTFPWLPIGCQEDLEVIVSPGGCTVPHVRMIHSVI